MLSCRLAPQQCKGKLQRVDCQQPVKKANAIMAQGVQRTKLVTAEVTAEHRLNAPIAHQAPCRCSGCHSKRAHDLLGSHHNTQAHSGCRHCCQYFDPHASRSASECLLLALPATISTFCLTWASTKPVLYKDAGLMAVDDNSKNLLEAAQACLQIAVETEIPA